jgi:hypothetical protein
MANEWQSLLQGAPNLQNLNLLGNFNTGYSTAVEQKKTAYDMYRQQKAQEIVGKSTRPGGDLDWDMMFKLGNEAGLGLDAFEQVNKMQQARRANEVAVLQHRANLESMGYDPTRWDPSAGNPVQVPAGGTPYVAPTPEEAARYDFLTRVASGESTPETQIPQAQAQQFGAQGVGGTAQIPGAPSAFPAGVPQDVVGDGTARSPMDLGEGTLSGQAPATKTGMYQLEAPPMRDPDLDSRVTEGYFNRLWRTGRSQADAQRAMGLDLASTEVPLFDITGMHGEQKDRLAKFLAMQGINPGETDAELQTAVQLRKQAVVDAIPQPAPVMPEGMGFEAMAKAQNLNRKNMIDWVKARQEAGIAFDKAMQEGNYAVLEKQLAQTASGLAKQASARQEAEFQRDRAAANKLKEMGVTDRLLPAPDVKALQDVFIPAIADISNADNGFGGAMQAAIAKAKVDGSVNMDVVISNLVSMGAMPSDQGAKIMAKMTPEAYTNFASMLKAGSVDQVMSGLRAIGIDVGTGTGATNPTWKDQALDNVFQQAQAHGMTESYYNKQRSKSWQSASPVEVLSSAPNAPRPRENKAPARTGWYKDADGVMRKH